jgi:hypothetical protein
LQTRSKSFSSIGLLRVSDLCAVALAIFANWCLISIRILEDSLEEQRSIQVPSELSKQESAEVPARHE